MLYFTLCDDPLLHHAGKILKKFLRTFNLFKELDNVDLYVFSEKIATEVADIKFDLGSLLTMDVECKVLLKLSMCQIYIQTINVMKSLGTINFSLLNYIHIQVLPRLSYKSQ